MKKLIFVDNDTSNIAIKTVEDYVKNNLKNFGELSEDYLDSMTIVPDFWKLQRDEVFEMAFNPENAIITWSVYTRSLMTDSKLQIIGVLRTAGQCNIGNCIYIDTTGMLEEAIYNYVRAIDAKGVIDILKAIESNYIITLKNSKFQRMRIHITPQKVFNLEPTVLQEILQ